MIGESERVELAEFWAQQDARRHRKPRRIWLAAALVCAWAGLVLTTSYVLGLVLP